ncbi:QsdR family transcriptional regulator [Nocardioides marmorisolisilvae]|uniref:QsdR family transcriptional regulator n=1 Tax=Nocardioides marmorisolisilvae TaxID=1542737 RepID=UPI0016169BB9|nr:QsdR family transcriptional regulator [Nocardioides marmorisolisilvae]
MVTPPDAYAAATRTYVAGERLDMRELAGELAISRNTLYRWTGGREQLLADVIWDLSEKAIADIWAGTSRRRGASRLREALRLYLETVVSSEPLHAFLRNETHAALRLLTARGPFQDRLVAEVARLMQAEADRCTWTPRGPVDTLAYAVVRLIEGFVYNDAIVQQDTAVDDAMTVIDLLLA